MSPRVRLLAWLASSLSLAACSSSASAPSASGPPPTIVGLLAVFQTAGCTRTSPGNRGVTGTLLNYQFTYTVPGGILQGGHLQVNRVYDTGDAESETLQIPAEQTGATSGLIRVGGCPRYNNATLSTETITLFDTANRASNSLTTTVAKTINAP